MTVGYAYFSRDLYIPLGYIYISVGISIFLWGYIYSCGDIYIPVGIYIFLWGYIYSCGIYIFLWGYIFSCGDICIPVGIYIPVGYIIPVGIYIFLCVVLGIYKHCSCSYHMTITNSHMTLIHTILLESHSRIVRTKNGKPTL